MKKMIICCCVIFFFLSVIGCNVRETWSCRILSSSNSSEVGRCWEETWSDSDDANTWCEAKVKSEVGFFSTNVTYKISNESCP
jgi:hypothetical protein